MATEAKVAALVEKGELHKSEAQLALKLGQARRASFVAGRLAMAQALADSQVLLNRTSRAPILRSIRGAPVMPAGIPGSISHKELLALAVVVPPSDAGTHRIRFVGIDLESRPTTRDMLKPSLAARILTETELEMLRATNADAQVELDLLRTHFAIKEAVYKAIDPFVQRYVRFSEVELPIVGTELKAGDTAVDLLLPEMKGGDIAVRAQWIVSNDWIVATAYSFQRGGA